MKRDWVPDAVTINDLFTMTPNIFDKVEFITCHNGQEVTHTVNKEFDPALFQKGLQMVC